MEKRRVCNHNDKYVVFYEFDDGAFEDVTEPTRDADVAMDTGKETDVETEDD